MGMCAIFGFKYESPLDDGEDHDSSRSGSSSDGGHVVSKREQRGAGKNYDQHPALWKRTIPKGRRCEPLEFSGLILYDEHGNRLHHFGPDAYPHGRPQQDAQDDAEVDAA